MAVVGSMPVVGKFVGVSTRGRFGGVWGGDGFFSPLPTPAAISIAIGMVDGIAVVRTAVAGAAAGVGADALVWPLPGEE